MVGSTLLGKNVNLMVCKLSNIYIKCIHDLRVNPQVEGLALEEVIFALTV